MPRNLSYATCIIISIILSLLFTNNLLAKNRLALLIGNSKYIHGGNLKNSVTDVRAMKRALENLGFTVLKYENATQKTMKRAMDKFGVKLKGKDVGLFFYAGHGVQVKGHNYLIPTDAKMGNENDAEYVCVKAGRILAKMESAGTRTNIVILDACRVNPFERSWRRGPEGSGLAFMNAPSGSLIAYSTAPGKTALDGKGSNSPYTSALLQHIDTPNITVLQMFQRVRSTVMNRSRNQQTPWEATSLRENFYFSSKGTDNKFIEERARLARERQELEQLRAEIERKQHESQRQRDGAYVAYANGIVKDTKTGLEWIAGPDRHIPLFDAKEWVQSLNLDGGGWRLPTWNELAALYKRGAGTRKMTPLLKGTGSWVWSQKKIRTYGNNNQYRSSTLGFNFRYGDSSFFWGDPCRAFAVRSR